VAKFDLKAYARQGAAARVAELNEELAAIFRVFPELRSGSIAQSNRLGIRNQQRGFTSEPLLERTTDGDPVAPHYSASEVVRVRTVSRTAATRCSGSNGLMRWQANPCREIWRRCSGVSNPVTAIIGTQWPRSRAWRIRS
jgi:hypothetical protein